MGWARVGMGIFQVVIMAQSGLALSLLFEYSSIIRPLVEHRLLFCMAKHMAQLIDCLVVELV